MARRPAGAPPDPPAVTRLGRFRVERELGRGGFGVVFLASDPILKRLVALKVPRPRSPADAGPPAASTRGADPE